MKASYKNIQILKRKHKNYYDFALRCKKCQRKNDTSFYEIGDFNLEKGDWAVCPDCDSSLTVYEQFSGFREVKR